MQWIGALLFIVLTTWIGFHWSDRLGKRPKQIRQLKMTLQILEAEMLYSQLPLRDAFLIIAKKTPQPIDSLFTSLASDLQKQDENFFTLWSKHVDRLGERSALGRNEQEILKQFGQTLGQHDFMQQQKQIYLTTQYLDRELEEAIEQQYKYGNMARLLGFLTGLFIVILLI